MMRANGSRAADRYVATANLAAVLEAQGRKQSWLAERLGVSKPLLCLIIGGVKTVDLPRGQQIADVLGVPFRLLFKLRNGSNMVSERKPQPPPVAVVGDAVRPRLVVRHGDRQRELRPASGPGPGQNDNSGRSPPGRM